MAITRKKTASTVRLVWDDADHQQWETEDLKYYIYGQNSQYFTPQERGRGFHLTIKEQDPKYIASLKRLKETGINDYYINKATGEAFVGWFATRRQAEAKAASLEASGITFAQALERFGPYDKTNTRIKPHPFRKRSKTTRR